MSAESFIGFKMDSLAGLRGELREEVPDHLPSGGLQGDGEEVLQAAKEGMQRPGSGGVQGRLRVLLHHQVSDNIPITPLTEFCLTILCYI